MGLGEILVLVSIVIVVINRRRIPELFGSVSDSIKAFKTGIKENNSKQVEPYKEKPDKD